MQFSVETKKEIIDILESKNQFYSIVLNGNESIWLHINFEPDGEIYTVNCNGYKHFDNEKDLLDFLEREAYDGNDIV